MITTTAMTPTRSSRSRLAEGMVSREMGAESGGGRTIASSMEYQEARKASRASRAEELAQTWRGGGTCNAAREGRQLRRAEFFLPWQCTR